MVTSLKIRIQPLIQLITAGLLATGLWLAAGWLVGPTAAAQGPCGQSYTVVYGDSLSQIAARCDVTVPALLQANPNLTNPNLIYVGTRLQLPAADEDTETVYTVQPGDTLRQIAAQFNTTISALLQANPGIRDPDLILVGQRLAIPDRPETSPASVAISPTQGPPGTTVQVTATGLPANTSLQVGAGVINTEFGVTQRAATNANGRLQTELTIPEFAEPGETWVVVIRQVERGGLRATSNPFQVVGPVSRTQIYLVALEDGGRRGREIGCNDSLVPVEVAIEPAGSPLRAALDKLLGGYEQEELYNALSRSELQVEDITVENGQAAIELTGTVRLGGVCDNPRFQAQLEQTARQFPFVDQVSIWINGRPLEEILSQK